MILERLEWGDVDAPPVVCIHGVGSNKESWTRVAEERWSKHFRVIAFDLRGHGRSGWNPPWDHATYVTDLIESVAALGIERPDWVGYSFGGRLLLDMAASHPQHVGRSVLVEPVIQVSPELAWHRADQELTGDVWESVDAFLAGRENVGSVELDPQLVAETAAEFDPLPDGRVKRRTCQSAIVSIFSEFAAAPPPPDTLTRPTMLLYAPEFGLVTPEQRAAYAPYVDEVVEVPGQHAVFWTAFDETATAVERFLSAPA